MNQAVKNVLKIPLKYYPSLKPQLLKRKDFIVVNKFNKIKIEGTNGNVHPKQLLKNPTIRNLVKHVIARKPVPTKKELKSQGLTRKMRIVTVN